MTLPGTIAPALLNPSSRLHEASFVLTVAVGASTAARSVSGGFSRRGQEHIYKIPIQKQKNHDTDK